MKNLNYYFQKALKEGFAIGQFNISNLETIRAVVLAAKNLESPVIIGTSEGESKFLGLKQAVALVEVFEKETGFPIFLNLDHGKSLDYIKEAISAGYNSCHFDGSKLPLDENIEITQKIMKLARPKGVLIEGEVGFVGGASKVLEKAPELKEEDLTDPSEAQKFIKETGVDRLAVNVGTFHGMEASGREIRVNLKRLIEIKKAVGVFPLVLHGASGVNDEDIKEAIKLGIVKINLNTEIRLAFTNTLRKVLDENPEEIVPYNYFPQVIESVQKVVEEKIKLFGSNNKI